MEDQYYDIERRTAIKEEARLFRRRIIGKTTYVASLHFKEQGQTFAQKLKRVLKVDCNA